MRNLKRVLSLALASVMLLGMMVIGAGAASVNDMDKVVNKEAVALMVDLGIIEGDNTGAFNPTGTINRGIRNNSDYTVLRKTNMPAILVETGFMSSHNELMNLCDSDYQMLLAQGMAEGIMQYFNQAG